MNEFSSGVERDSQKRPAVSDPVDGGISNDPEAQRRHVLNNKLVMLQKEERSLKSFLHELRNQQYQLKIENMRLLQLSEQQQSSTEMGEDEEDAQKDL